MPRSSPSPGTPYGEFLAELDEIQLHKWHLSEVAGKDVGFERALNDWSLRHRVSWRHMRNAVRSQITPSLP